MVAPRHGDSCLEPAGRVLDFRLRTPLQLRVHTPRKMDGRILDLVATVHGPCLERGEVEASPVVDLQVQLLRLEARLAPETYAAALTALVDAAKAGSATIGNGPGELPSVAAEVLAVLGFQAASESQWACSMVTANAAWRPMQGACTAGQLPLRKWTPRTPRMSV